MTLGLNPYLHFAAGTARQAGEFYESVLGGELQILTFGAFNQGDPDPTDDNVMHAALTTPEGLVLMLADNPPGEPAAPFGGFSVSLSGDDETTLRRYFDGLSTGGTVFVPLAKQMWGDVFGNFTDKFGVSWVVNISAGE